MTHFDAQGDGQLGDADPFAVWDASTDEVAEPPGAYVERVRTEAARRQLEETDDTVVAIAARCGFGTAETMRRNFVRRIGVSPDQYRKTFA